MSVVPSANFITAPVKISDVTSLVGISSAIRGGQVTQEFMDKANYTSIAFPYCGLGNNSIGVETSLTTYPTFTGNYIGGHGYYTKCGTGTFKGKQAAQTTYVANVKSNLYEFKPSKRKLPNSPTNLGDWIGYRHNPYDYTTLVPGNTPYTNYTKDFPFYFEVTDVSFSGPQITVSARYSAYMADIISTTLTTPKTIPSGWIGLNRMLATQNATQFYLTIGFKHSGTQGSRGGGAEVWIANNGMEELNATDNSVTAKTITCTLGNVMETTATNWAGLSNKGKIWKGEVLEVFPVLVAAPQTIPISSTGISCKFCELPASLYTCKAGTNGTNPRYCTGSGKLQINYLSGKWYFGVKEITWKPTKNYGTTKPDGSYYYFTSSLTVFPESASSGAISGQSIIQGRVQSYNTETRTETSFTGYDGGTWKTWSNQIGKMYPTTNVPNGTSCSAGMTVRVQMAFTSPDNEQTVIEVKVELPTNTNDTTLVNFYI